MELQEGAGHRTIVDRTTQIGLESLLRQARDLRRSLFNLEQDTWRGASWQDMMNHFGVILVQIDKLYKQIQDQERTPHLESLVLAPSILSTDASKLLAQITEGRLQHFAHDIVPTLLRTKLLPEMEQEQAAALSHPQGAAAVSVDEQKQVAAELKPVLDGFLGDLEDLQGSLAGKQKESLAAWFPERAPIQTKVQASSLKAMLAALDQGQGLK